MSVISSVNIKSRHSFVPALLELLEYLENLIAK